MEVSQQFCLKWNNYQSTLTHIFQRLWERGLFVDVTLIVEGRKIDCHKVILSACSSYFEQLLSDHATHPHPLILLHDIPFAALESLVMFMYKGEINVSHGQLAAVLKVAETLKIKGLADSEAIYNFAKYNLIPQDITNVSSSDPPTLYNYPSYAQLPMSQPYINNPQISLEDGATQRIIKHINGSQRNEFDARSQKPPKKRCRQEEPITPLPLSPPISLGEIQNTEQAQPSSPQEINKINDSIKVELEEETDNELQIDESVGHSTPDFVESDSNSDQNTPGHDADSRDSDERTETAHSLAALATQGSAFRLLDPSQNQHLIYSKVSSVSVKTEKGTNGFKNGERSYTLKDLEEGIEAVLNGNLTPAKAIAKFKVPRRTFFRRLSAVRKVRGIPSSKENSSENYVNAIQRHSPSPLSNEKKMSKLPLIVPTIVPNDSTFMTNLTKVVTKGNSNAFNFKKDKKLQGISPGNVFSLMNVQASPNYDYYLNYFKIRSQQNHKELSDDEIDTNADSHRNISTSESTVPEPPVALMTQNGPVN